jgi:hypothetical protein
MGAAISRTGHFIMHDLVDGTAWDGGLPAVTRAVRPDHLAVVLPHEIDDFHALVTPIACEAASPTSTSRHWQIIPPTWRHSRACCRWAGWLQDDVVPLPSYINWRCSKARSGRWRGATPPRAQRRAARRIVSRCCTTGLAARPISVTAASFAELTERRRPTYASSRFREGYLE